ncbi:MAG: Na+/H+ antiporter NhaA [Myxococcota bacterium]|nr:Na+/H+ antiporter NhaA [Myxococcota bacterium]
MATHESFGGDDTQLPEEPVDRLVEPFARFLHVEAAGGLVLLATSSVALIVANSPWAASYFAFWKTPLGISVGDFEMTHSLKHWVSDGLMAIFFFVIGLEVKREFILGELRDMRKAALPIAAALGGMVLPAAIYLSLLYGEPGERGWGIPMATDIAFVVGGLAVLGSRVPPGLRILLLSLAIADDIGAILVIAIGYTERIDWDWLLFGLAAIALVSGLARIGVRSVPLYVVVGAAVWLGFHESGIHATIAGVILGVMTPARSWVSGWQLRAIAERADRYLHGERWENEAQRAAVLQEVETAARETVSPLRRLENLLHPWQSMLIVPLFALANAGVAFQLGDLVDPIAIAVIAGLGLGKPVGIFLFSWVAVRVGLARLPEGLSWTALFGGGCLAGIGFTMALFIAGLAMTPAQLPMAKVGVLAGSAVSALLGMTILVLVLPKDETQQG